MALLSLLQHTLQELITKTPFNVFLSLLFLLSFLYLFKLTRAGKFKLPPSPPKLPIIGNIHQLGTLPHRSLGALSEKYGPLMLLHLGHSPTLVVSSADMVQEMMKTHDIIFSNRPKTTAADILFYGCVDVGFAPYGEYWRKVRKISVHEFLSPKRVQSFQFVREEEVAVLMNRIRNACLKGDSVNLSELLTTASKNIVWRCILGQKFEEEDGKSEFGELSRRMMTQFADFSLGDFFPYLWWVDILTGLIPRLRATFRVVDALLDHVIEEHKTTKSDDHQSDERDFLDILLQLQKDDIELTQDNIKAIILDMFVGGSDTTSTALIWLMAELVKNPIMFKRAQEEVRGVMGKKSKIDVSDINQMEYLKCILKETLRLHPSLPLSVPRETLESVKLGGYDIPEKTKVFVNIWAIQRDPKLWDRPEEFLPERFKNNPVDFKGQDDFQLIPFGGGRRGCPGLTFAVAAMEYVIANLLYWFDWRLPGADVRGEDLDMGETNGLTVQKTLPLHLVPILHSP